MKATRQLETGGTSMTLPVSMLRSQNYKPQTRTLTWAAETIQGTHMSHPFYSSVGTEKNSTCPSFHSMTTEHG